MCNSYFITNFIIINKVYLEYQTNAAQKYHTHVHTTILHKRSYNTNEQPRSDRRVGSKFDNGQAGTYPVHI